MTTYCAPCLADLALVREAVTAVSGTASCMAHAVLLTHPTDTPQRRLTRLSELRTLAEGKLLTASTEDAPAIELLVQEFALAGAMDMTVPLRDLAGDRTPRPPKARRGRERGPRPEGERRPDGERGPRPERGDRGPRPTEPPAGEGGDAPTVLDVTTATEAPAAPAEAPAAPSEASAPAPSEAPAPAEAPAAPAEAPAAPAEAPAAPAEAPAAPAENQPSV